MCKALLSSASQVPGIYFFQIMRSGEKKERRCNGVKVREGVQERNVGCDQEEKESILQS